MDQCQEVFEWSFSTGLVSYMVTYCSHKQLPQEFPRWCKSNRVQDQPCENLIEDFGCVGSFVTLERWQTNLCWPPLPYKSDLLLGVKCVSFFPCIIGGGVMFSFQENTKRPLIFYHLNVLFEMLLFFFLCRVCFNFGKD